MAQVKKKAKNKKESLYEACVKGEFEELLTLIEEANSRDETKLFTWPYQTHPLHFAAAYGDLDVVRTLIEKYCYDAECRNSEGVTPLHFASLGGHAHVVDYLLKERHCNPNLCDEHKASPLHYVCYGTYDNLQPHNELERFNQYYIYTDWRRGEFVASRKPINFYYKLLESVCLVGSAEKMYYNTAMKLHYNRGHINIARNLLLHNGNPFAKTSLGQQPMLLELACQCGSIDAFQNFAETIHFDTRTNVKSLLSITCKYEHEELVLFMFEKYVNQPDAVKLSSADINDILMVACSVGNLAIVKCIVDQSVVVATVELVKDAADHGANHYVLKYLTDKMFERITSLIENASSSNVQDRVFIPIAAQIVFSRALHSLLQVSLYDNNFELMRAIINERTIKTIGHGPGGNTTLHCICNKSNLKFLKYLLTLVGNDPSLSGVNNANYNGLLPLHIACFHDNIDIIRLVSPHHDFINIQGNEGNTALHIACMNENVAVETIQYLVEELGINLSCQNNLKEFPLHTFCGRHRLSHSMPRSPENPDNDTIIVKLLSSRLTFNVDMQDIFGQTPLHIICRNVGNVDIARYLTQDKECSQSVRNNEGQTPLHIVVGQYSRWLALPTLMEMVKLVSGHPTFLVNIQDNDGDTPLHIACKTGNLELIQYLVNDKQCDQNIQNNDGRLPLHIILGQLNYANYEEKLISESVKVSKLVSNQANLNIDAQDQDGNTPLHIACKYRNFELVRYLTQEKECNQNVQNSVGWLPLHIVINEMCSRGNSDMSLLVSMVRLVSSQSRLNVHAQDQNGYTPLHLACQYEAKEVIKYLVFEKNCVPTEQPNHYSSLRIHVACTEPDDFSLLKMLATKDNVNYQGHRHHNWRTTALHIACESENIVAVKLLLLLGCNLNVTNDNGELPLHIACRKGSLILVKLVADCVELNSIAQYSIFHALPPLHLACIKHSTSVVKFLIENKHCNPHLLTRNGDTLLHSACRSGATDIVQYLVESDSCDSNTLLMKLNKQKQYAFHIACTKSLKLVKMTSRNFSTEQLMSKIDEDFNCLHLASSHGLVDVVEYLVEQGCSPFTEDEYGINALGSACGLRAYSVSEAYNKREEIHPDIVRYLVAKCFLDPTKPQGTFNTIICPSLFEHACKLPNLELMKALTVANINFIDSNGNTPLHIACKFGQVDMVEYLVQQGCDQTIQNKESELALHLASSKSVELVELLTHSNPDVQCSSGDTALHIACRNLKKHIVTHFVQQRRCNTSIPNFSTGELPIHIACSSSKCNSNILRCLVKANHSDTFVKNGLGKLPLHLASEFGNIKLLKILISSDPKSTCMNEIDFNGNTALHLACKGKHFHAIEWLVKHGAKASAETQNNKGDTPAHLCIKHNDQVDRQFYNDRFRSCQTPRLTTNKIKIVKLFLLLDSSYSLLQNEDGDLLIHLACREKGVEIITYLSKQDTFGDSLLVQNAQGDTPLHIALKVAASKHIVELVTRPAICTSQNKHGNTALHLICVRNKSNDYPYSVGHQMNLRYRKYLIKQSDVRLVNSSGQLPLHIAAMHSWTNNKFLNMLLVSVEMITFQDKDGNTPLHLACKHKNRELTQYFIDKMNDHCNTTQTSAFSTSSNLLAVINQGNADGDTPLHLAIQSGDENLVQYLVKCEVCNLTMENKYGETALHIACSKSSLKMVQMVFSTNSFGQINADSPKKSGSIFPGDTPLHVACRVGNVDVVKYLIKNGADSVKAAMGVPNAQKELPIHLSCSESHSRSANPETLLRLTMSFSERLVNSQTLSNETVLHMACKLDYCTTILAYLIDTIHCDVNMPNCDGDLPFHLICRHNFDGDLLHNLELIVSVLQTNSIINAQNNLGNTLLHEVCKHEILRYYHDRADMSTEVVEYLLEQGCDKQLHNNDNETALFLACRYQTLSVVKLLLHDSALGVSKEGNSVLHYTCLNVFQIAAYNIICHLAVEFPQHFNVNASNNTRATPIHFACKMNNLEVVQYLVTKGADISHADINGQTPLTLATDPSIIKLLLEHGADPSPLYILHKNFFQHSTSSGAPPPTPLKVLVVGDPGAGKTTLVESLKNEDGENIRQTETFGHTAGVIPNDFSSQIYGEVTMYDFAGHSEYYSSHGGVIHSIIKNSPPVIMVLVNLTKDMSEIRDRALYWTKFVLDYCASLDGKPHFLIIGSHADILKETGENPMPKVKALVKMIEVKVSTKAIVKSALTIDCTQSQSPEINKLRQHLQKSASKLREKTAMKFSSHCIYVFLQQQFRYQPAVRLDYLLNTLSRQSSLNQKRVSQNSNSIIGFLPATDLENVAQMCEELSESGHVLFVKHPQTSRLKQSWIVLRKDILLHEVIGQLFAPADFPEHISLANSTGVVPFSKLKLLPYDPNLLTGFLTHMEYCKEILDQETLQLLSHERSSRLTVHPDSQILDEKYFFFPSLVSVERPCEVWKPDKPNFTYQCGLILECDLEQEDFFNPQFIQVLLLRLAFTYAVKPTRTKRREYGDGVRVHDIVERRVCTVWKSGLHWLERSGIETLVDVIDNNKILILMQCLDNVKVKCLKRRSEILSTIMTTKMKLCPNPQITPYLLNPNSIQHPLPPLSEVSLFTMDDINVTIEESEGTLIINDSKDCLEQNELLFFEPYAHLCQSIVDCLFNSDSNALEEVVSDDFLHHVCHHLSPCYNYVVELISKHITQSGHMSASVSSSAPSIPAEKLFQMFKVWQRRQPQNSGGTYLELRSVFNEVSLFPSLGSTPTGACCVNYHGPRISDIDFDDDDSDNLEPTDKTCQGHLSIKDLKQVRSEIWKVRPDWEDLGIELDLDPSSLKVISKECSNKVSACFTEMLTIWLKGEGCTKPTWFALVEALKSETVNHPRLAEDLMENLTSKGL